MLVWLAMVTGVRRGELCGIRWRHLDLQSSVLRLDRSIGQRSGQMWEKDTKTHQQRRIALDQETVRLLVEHRERCVARAAAAHVALREDAFVFSLVPDGSGHLQPNYVSQRYGKLVKRLGIETSIHKLRHYSATELIAAGVDVRTVAGRLGHGGGGTTTLRTYAAWVSESDQRAASNLATRLPTRPESAVLPPVDEADSNAPYLTIANAIRNAIERGGIRSGNLLPGVKQIAERYGVSVGTAHRAVSVLVNGGHVEVQRRRGIRVLDVDAPVAADGPNPTPNLDLPTPIEPTSPTPSVEVAKGSMFLNLEVRRQRQILACLMAEADPRKPAVLKRLLLDALRRAGVPSGEAGDYEMDIRDEEDRLLATFVIASTE